MADIDVLCVGITSYDLVFTVDHHPQADEKSIADALISCGGGPAANAAVTVAKLGLKSAFLRSVRLSCEDKKEFPLEWKTLQETAGKYKIRPLALFCNKEGYKFDLKPLEPNRTEILTNGDSIVLLTHNDDILDEFEKEICDRLKGASADGQ